MKNHMIKSKRPIDYRVPYVALVLNFLEDLGVDLKGEFI